MLFSLHNIKGTDYQRDLLLLMLALDQLTKVVFFLVSPL